MPTKREARIIKAFWVSPSTGCLLLNRNWKWRGLPPVQLQSKNLSVTWLRTAPLDYIGRFQGVYERKDGKIIFCQEASRHPHIDLSKTPVRVVGPFNNWGKDESKKASYWELSPRRAEDGTILWECVVDRKRIDGGRNGVPFKFVTSDWKWLRVLDQAPNRVIESSGIVNYHFLPRRSGTHAFLFEVTGGRPLVGSHSINLKTNGEDQRVAIIPGLSFYDLSTDLPLGSRIEQNRVNLSFIGDPGYVTIFRVFAPRATRVKVLLSKDLGDHSGQEHPMKLLSDGLTWEARVPGNLHGWYYYLRVDGKNIDKTTHFEPQINILDPWALATVGPKGPAIVVDRTRLPTITNSDSFTPPCWHDLVILESHVRDLVAKAPFDLTKDERLGFRGLTKWITDQQCYVRELGINALELLPVHQFDSETREEYHWGYMTTNFFSPCAHYAKSPEHASQIEEFRALVDACHRQKIAVIADVVYNHVGEPPYLLYLDKEYFFQVEDNGSLNNLSGCGNTLRADSKMVKRLIIDSLLHMVDTFGVDGFRFDLAELLTVETVKEIEVALKAAKESIIIITEPWSFRGNISWDLRNTGVSFWNDGYREYIANYLRGHGNADGLRYFMKGCLDHLSTFPAQSINYLSSHDDYCWIDKITENSDHNGTLPTSNDVHRTHLMCAILMGSIGVPMIAAGTDFMQSKNGVHNTYLRGDLNALQYDRKTAYESTHEYFKQWIRFRQSPWGELIRLWQRPTDGFLRPYTADGNSSLALLFNADGSHGSRQILFAINPHFDSVIIPLKDLPSEGWLEIANRDSMDFKGLSSDRLCTTEQSVKIGPLDCGVWIRGGDLNSNCD